MPRKSKSICQSQESDKIVTRSKRTSGNSNGYFDNVLVEQGQVPSDSSKENAKVLQATTLNYTENQVSAGIDPLIGTSSQDLQQSVQVIKKCSKYFRL